MNRTRRSQTLGGLAALHLAAGPASALLVRGSWPGTDVVVFLAFLLADASLIGLLAGLSASAPLLRLAFAAAGSGFLLLLPGLTVHGYHGALPMFAAMVVLSLFPGFSVATAMRRLPPRWRLAIVEDAADARPQVQVSIRFLFVFTAAVAVLLAILQAVEKRASDTNVIAGVVLPLTYGWICCVAALAVLVPRQAGFSAAAAIALCSLVGIVPAHYMGGTSSQVRPPLPWIALAAIDAAVIVFTLLVVRRCGYRLAPQATKPCTGEPLGQQPSAR